MRHRQQRALGQAAMQVVEIHRHEFDVREIRSPSRYSPLRKRAGSALVAARALGKDDQRIALAQRGAQRLERIRLSAFCARAVDEHGAEAAGRDVFAQSRCPSNRARRSAACAGAVRAAAKTRSPACRCGWCDWRSRCAARCSGCVPIQRAYAPTSSLTTPTSSALDGRMTSYVRAERASTARAMA